jgi:tetratricopeptide (TPR) repeat protein
MKATTELVHVIVWLALTLASFNLRAAKEPLYDGLGSYSREITTGSPEAQRYFNQGLAFVHGFNYNAAIRAFQQAADLDRECAMAHWGIALACGPHINLTVVPPLPRSWLGKKLVSLRSIRAARRRWKAR